MRLAFASIASGATLIAAGAIAATLTPAASGLPGTDTRAVALTATEDSFAPGPDGTFPELYWALFDVNLGEYDLAHGVATEASNRAAITGVEFSQFIDGVAPGAPLPTMPDPPLPDTLVGEEITILEHAGPMADLVRTVWLDPLNEQWDAAASALMNADNGLSYEAPTAAHEFSQAVFDLNFAQFASLPVQWVADMF